VTGFLRARGFDVVEMRNYKRFDVLESLVIDRTGSTANAETGRLCPGIEKKNIVQQINEDYFVDVSVVLAGLSVTEHHMRDAHGEITGTGKSSCPAYSDQEGG